MRVGLVGCVKRKSDHPRPAQDLYISDMFRKRRAHVESSCGRWFILSAKYGLVEPLTVIEPYDLTLNDLPAQQRRQWSQRVLVQLERAIGDLTGLDFEIHAGSPYRNYGVVDGLERLGAGVVIPASGLSFGRQLSFYKSAVTSHSGGEYSPVQRKA
jgi:hypothetical protein